MGPLHTAGRCDQSSMPHREVIPHPCEGGVVGAGAITDSAAGTARNHVIRLARSLTIASKPAESTPANQIVEVAPSSVDLSMRPRSMMSASVPAATARSVSVQGRTCPDCGRCQAPGGDLHGDRFRVLAQRMRLTKLEHSALILEDSGRRLIVDPGSLTTPLVIGSGTVAVVITHEHADHWSPEQLTRILDKSPDARIFGPAGVARAARGFDVQEVAAGQTHEVGPFRLRFFGSEHAVIHSSIPVIDNVGVLVNEVLYYAGDSFTIPEGVDVPTLAVPAGAPWLKIGEVIDYVTAIAPRRSFPVHEMVLSVAGKKLSNDRIGAATEQGGGEFFPLEPGDTLDL